MTPFIVTDAEMGEVYRLTYEAYLAEGYCRPNADGSLKHFPKLDGIKETRVYGIRDKDGVLQATCSATLDGPRGLHTDEAFLQETDYIRQECRNMKLRLCSSWRIASLPQNRGRRKVIMSLIDYTLSDFGALADVWLFTFNPSHAGFYQRVLDLAAIAGPRDDAVVDGAPAVLMRGELPAMRQRWSETLEATA